MKKINKDKWEGIKVRKYKDFNYHSIWCNLKTVRLGNGEAKELPPNHAEFYDVSLGTKCNLECPFCYTNAKTTGIFYDNIIEKAEKFFGYMSENQKPTQIAIGSEGCPTIHPDFCEFLETIYNLGIVPNYTTNGITISNILYGTDEEYNLGQKILDYTEKYCGGVAVSANTWNERINDRWKAAVNILSTRDIHINIHYIIKDKESVNEFLDIYNEFKDKVLYFVVLPLMDSGRSVDKFSEESFDYLVSQELDFSKIAFGAHFYESLVKNQDKLKCWLYPPESLSKNLILDDTIKITPSSFSNEVIWSCDWRNVLPYEIQHIL